MILSLPGQASSNPNEKCQGALSKKTGDQLQSPSFRSANWTPIIEELVELISSGRAEWTVVSPWRLIGAQSLVAEKKAEIERVLGKEVARDLLREVQARVMRRIMVLDNGAHRDRKRVSSDSSEKRYKVKVLKPFVIKHFVGHKGGVRSAVFSPDGSRVLTASADATAKLWDAKTGHLLHTFEGHIGDVTSANFSPDGFQVLTASSDGTGKLWSLYVEVDVDRD